MLADVEKAHEQTSLYAPLLNSKPRHNEVFDQSKEVQLEMIFGDSGKEPDKAKGTKIYGQGSKRSSINESNRDSDSGGNYEAQRAAREARRKVASELKKEEVSWSIPID